MAQSDKRQPYIIIFIIASIALVGLLILGRFGGKLEFDGDKSSESMSIDFDDSSPKVSASYAGKNISFLPVNFREGAKVERNSEKLIWKDIYEDTDLVYERVDGGIKETIVLKSEKSPTSFSFRFNVPEGIVFEKDLDNNIVFFESNSTNEIADSTTGSSPLGWDDGLKRIKDSLLAMFLKITNNDAGIQIPDSKFQIPKYLYHIPPPVIWDSIGKATTGVEVEILKNKEDPSDFVFILKPNINWLLAPERVYPLYLDPSIVHDTEAEFDAGKALNRVESLAGPKVQLPYHELPADEHTVGLWHMNNNWNDSSGNGNNGTAYGGATFTTSAKLGSHAGSFDGGDDYVSISPIDQNVYTFEGWFKSGVLDTTTNRALIGSNRFLIQAYSNKIRVWHDVNYAVRDFSTTIENNIWHHFAVIIDYTNWQITAYLDGVSLGTQSTTTQTKPSISSQQIGSYGAGRYFSGLIDEVRILNRALTPEEIKADAERRPYGVYTSSVLDLTADITSIDSISWTESITPPTAPSGWTKYKPVIIDNTQSSGSEYSWTETNFTDAGLSFSSTTEDSGSVRLTPPPVELDYMEYSSDANAQAAYVSSEPISYGSDVTSAGLAHYASSIYGDSAANNISDNDLTNTNPGRWITNVDNPTTETVGIDFGSGVTKRIRKLRVYTVSSGVDLKNFIFQGANSPSSTTAYDATGWTNLLTAQASLSTGWQEWTFSNENDFRYYRLRIADCQTAGQRYIQCVEWELMEAYTVLQSYSESSIKQQGSYSLKGFAKGTNSLNDTLTRTVSPTINLSNKNTIKFDIRASRTGSNIKIGIHDSGGTTTETTPNIASANIWQTVEWDISGVSDANKDAIDQIKITITNADSDNTFYIDKMYAGNYPSSGTLESYTKDVGASDTYIWGTMDWNWNSTQTLTARVQTSATDSGWDLDNASLVTKGQDISSLSSVTDGHRYIRWKFYFSTSDDLQTPILNDITVNYGGGLADYQVKVHVDYDSNMQSDFDDLKFTNSAGTNLDYWIEEKSDGVEAEVWVEVDSIAASAVTTIFMWYGNAGASAGSNIGNTFIFGDDFEDGVIDTTNKWNSPVGNINEASGVLTINVPTPAWGHRLTSKNTFANDILISSRMKSDTAAAGTISGILSYGNIFSDTTNYETWFGHGLANNLRFGYNWYNGAAGTTVASTPISLNTYYTVSLAVTSSGAKAWKDSVLIGETTAQVLDNKLIDLENTAGLTSYDWIFVRKYTSPEPIVGIGGNIELQTRTGADNTPDDGDWEEWRPVVTSETQILSMDSSITPSWWNAAWDYRKKIPLTGAGSAETNYQVKIEVGYSSGGDVTCDSHCQTDFDDIRFTDNDGTTELNYWRESYTASDSATFWVKVNDSLSSGSNPDIYMYYGNNGASTGSNIDNVFTLGENDHPNPTLEADTGSWILGSGWSRSSDTAHGGSWSLKGTQSGTSAYIQPGWAQFDSLQDGELAIGYAWVKTSTSGIAKLTLRTAGAYSSSDYHPGDNQWHKLYITCMVNQTEEPAPWESLGLDGAGTAYGDDFYVGATNRQVVSPGPSIGTPGSETSNPLFTATDSGTTKLESDSTTKMEGTGSMKTTVGAPQVDANTVALWHMEETGGTGAYIKDSTANANHGTPTGTTVVDGWFGKGRDFDGSGDYIDTSSEMLFSGTTSFTVEAWFKTDTVAAGGKYILDRTTATNELIDLYRDGDDMVFRIRGDDGVGITTLTAANVLSTNTWYHVAGVRNVSTDKLELYLNGVLQGTTTDNTTGTNSSIIRIGDHSGAANSWDGVIDEVRISNVAHTAEEIAEAYRAGRDHRLSRTITSTDLSSNTKIPFYIAADRPGTYLEAAIGETDYSMYQADSNTVGLWHLDEDLSPGLSCKHILDNGGSTGNGVYWIDPSGGDTSDAFQAYCDMTTDGGGWTMVYNNLFSGNEGGPTPTNTSSVYGTVGATSDHGINGQTVFSQIGATEMLLKEDSNWVRFNNMTSAIFNTLWNVAGDATYSVTSMNGTTYTVNNSYHGHGSGVNQFGQSSPANQSVIFEYNLLTGTRDTNHYWHIWPNANGTYAINEGVGGDRWGSILVRESSIQSGAYIFAKDSSGNGNNGLPTGTTFTQGKIGKARSFDGSSDYISVPSSSSINSTTNAITISLWLKLNAAIGANYWSITRKESQFALDFPSANAIRFMGSNFWTGANDVSFNPVIGQWYHITATWSTTDNTGRIYVNGSEIKNFATSGSMTTNENALGIGANGSGSYVINGVIDEFQLDNTARSADYIRQSYQYGLRTHPITIDFVDSLNSANLIADTNDTSFTLSNANNMAQNLFVGDKIIVKENYDGTEYIAQGLVDSINQSTGAVTVSSWDAGSTFPSGGYTVNATVFKWQREYWDITDISPADRNAITKLNLRVLDASEGFTFWLDDIKQGGAYLTDPSGESVSSTAQRYMQYRVIFSAADAAVTPNLSQVTVNYSVNNKPTGTFVSAAEKTDGSGTVDISIEVDDLDDEDCKTKIEYTADETCSSGWVGSPNVTLAGPAVATYNDSGGAPDINNTNAYQIGSGTDTRIITSSGSNTLDFDWDSATDLPTGDSTYCLRLTTNDDTDDQETPATQTLTIDNVGPSGLTALTASYTKNSATLSWTAVTESHFDHYEIWYGTSQVDVQGRIGTALEWDGVDDGNMNTKSTTSTTITDLTHNTAYFFKIWASDTYGNPEETVDDISVTTNDPPVLHDGTTDNTLPALTQATDGTGKVTITFRIKDYEGESCSAGTVYYQVDGGDWNAITDGDITGTKTGLTSASDLTGALHTLTWDNSKEYIDNAESANLKIDFKANDSHQDSANWGISPAGFTLDNLDPSGLTALSVTQMLSSQAYLSWSAATETNWDHYEIWYGTGQSDVQGRVSSALEWDGVDDGNMNTKSTTSTIITGLSRNTTYYFKIWAIDSFTNEATVADTTDTTEPAACPVCQKYEALSSGYRLITECYTGGDTNDSDANTYPTEICDNSVDDEGDSLIDCADTSDCDGVKCALCTVCSGGTCSVAAVDDSACSTIDCSGWYVQTGTEGVESTEYCYNKQNITTNRCKGVADCKDANTADCDAQANSTQQYPCETCKYISASNCSGTTLGSCTNYDNGTSCQTCKECQSGNCANVNLTWSGSTHTKCDCTTAAGTVFDTGSGTICKFTASSCPDGWTQAANWQKYSVAEWGGDACGWHKSTGPATFSNQLAVKRWACCGDCNTDHGCDCCNAGQAGYWHTCQFQEYRCDEGWYCDLCWNVSSSNNPTDNRTEIGCY